MFYHWLWSEFRKRAFRETKSPETESPETECRETECRETEFRETGKVASVKLVVGLGNPGNKYADTRHNVGFKVIAELARRHALGQPRTKFKGEAVDANIQGVRTLLLCPYTYMNKSGSSVLAARDFYKTPDNELLLICDDFNLAFGRLRVRAKGSSGGQRGLEDVIRRIGTSEFTRLRIGIGTPHGGWDVADYVLSKFDQHERSVLGTVIERAADAVGVWLTEGTESCMNQFNSKA